MLLSVRQMSEDFGGEHQVYGWNQTKKESGLGQRPVTLSGQTAVRSSATYDNSISAENADGNQNTESSQFNFTENAPYTIAENRIENISAGSIRPVNGITGREKFDYLVSQFEESGYTGRPIVVAENSNDGYAALTGPYSILAAQEAGIDIPCVVIPYSDELIPILESNSDEDRVMEAGILRDNGEIDADFLPKGD